MTPDNQFRLWRDGACIASCPTEAAHNAARRLLMNLDGLCNPTLKEKP